MPDTAPDPVAAYLAEALTAHRDRAARAAPYVPRLIGAVEAAMRLHAPKQTANGIWLCPFCSCAQGEMVEPPCPEVQAISAALLGTKEGTDVRAVD